MNLEQIIVNALGKVKAFNIICFDTKEKSPFYDEMIISTVSSLRQADAAINYIKEDVEKEGYNIRAIEGMQTGWVIVDCYDIIVSIFTEEERNRFQIEKIYLDVPSKNL